MNNKAQATEQILDFLKSSETGMLITGTHQFEKHCLVMSILNRQYKNKKILFRINGMKNIDDNNFTPLKKKPKAGEFVKLGNNYYCFDAFTSSRTWSATNGTYDFAIVYPIDYICREHKMESIQELHQFRTIGKTFLCSWTDRPEYDYSILSGFYSSHVIFDAEEEDSAYHNRVLEIVKERH